VTPLAGLGDERSGSSLCLPIPTRGSKYGSEHNFLSGQHAALTHLRSSRAPTRDAHTSLHLDSIREFFTWRETHPVLCRDIDRFAISRVNALAGSTPAHFERAKAY